MSRNAWIRIAVDQPVILFISNVANPTPHMTPLNPTQQARIPGGNGFGLPSITTAKLALMVITALGEVGSCWAGCKEPTQSGVSGSALANVHYGLKHGIKGETLDLAQIASQILTLFNEKGRTVVLTNDPEEVFKGERKLKDHAFHHGLYYTLMNSNPHHQPVAYYACILINPNRSLYRQLGTIIHECLHAAMMYHFHAHPITPIKSEGGVLDETLQSTLLSHSIDAIHHILIRAFYPRLETPIVDARLPRGTQTESWVNRQYSSLADAFYSHAILLQNWGDAMISNRTNVCLDTDIQTAMESVIKKREGAEGTHGNLRTTFDQYKLETRRFIQEVLDRFKQKGLNHTNHFFGTTRDDAIVMADRGMNLCYRMLIDFMRLFNPDNTPPAGRFCFRPSVNNPYGVEMQFVDAGDTTPCNAGQER